MSSAPSLETVTSKTLQSRYVAWAKAEKTSGGLKGQQSRIVADYLRHALCRLAADDGKAGAVHVQRLLTAVRTQLSWLVPPVDEPPWTKHDDSPDEEPAESSSTVKDLVLLTLERLILLGDCGNKGEGYYLPAPLRRVVLGSGRSVIVGGLDTGSLAREVGGSVGWAGLARTVEKPERELPTEDLRDWLGTPREPLLEWTTQAMARATASLQSSPGRDGSEFEIYSPHSFRYRGMKGQSTCWASPGQWSPPRSGGSGVSLHLCRTRRRPRRFWLSPLEQGSREVKFRMESAVPREFSRRLMYGIDQLLGVPTKAEVIQQGTGAVEFRLYSWLPNEEYRLFTALCYQTQNAPDTPLPFIFHLSADFWPDAASALRGLGINVPDPRP